MPSSSDDSLIVSLNNVSFQLDRICTILLFLFGVVGNVINVLVLSQRPLCLNPCAWIFRVSSIFYCMAIFAGLIPRFLSTWNADMTSTNNILCKIHIFIYFDSATIASWLIMLATVDRWLSSSIDVNRRQRSTLKNAKRGVIFIAILSSLIETQNLYCYEANLTNTSLKCYTKSVTCAIASDLCLVLITILLPLLFMIMFGLMAIANIQRVESRLHPMRMAMNDGITHNTVTAAPEHQSQRKKTDRRLLIMLFIQILVILTLTLPLALFKFYTTITSGILKSSLRNAIENFLFNFFLLLSNLASGMPFYIYMLSGGTVFRKTLLNLMKMLARKMMCQCN